MPGIPVAEFAIDRELVRTLLHQSAPDLAGEKIWGLQEGWDNVIYRLGDSHCVRLPRRKVAVENIRTEQKWLPQLEKRLPLPIPRVVIEGQLSEQYDWPWSVLTWLPGSPVSTTPLLDSEALVLAEFLSALHTPAPQSLARSEIRGCALKKRKATIAECMKKVSRAEARYLPMLEQLWQDALNADSNTVETWVHGDFHALNVLATNGKLSGVIDWGDLSRGDPATDLACIWMLLKNKNARRSAMTLYDTDAATWQRAKGWAVFFGLVLLTADSSGISPYPNMGRVTLQRLAEDFENNS